MFDMIAGCVADKERIGSGYYTVGSTRSLCVTGGRGEVEEVGVV